MAFECTIDPNNLRLEVIEFGSESLVRVKLGCNQEFDYFLVVGFSPSPPLGELDFFFHILEFNDATGASTSLWEDAAISAVLPKEHRALVRDVLFASTGNLLRNVWPHYFTMVTHTPNLPNQAFVKFVNLCHIFTSHGYHVSKPDPYHGTHMWWMERAS